VELSLLTILLFVKLADFDWQDKKLKFNIFNISAQHFALVLLFNVGKRRSVFTLAVAAV
jgi:hypothetical protein